MKFEIKVLTDITQFRTLQSRVDWKDATFAFHFQKGLPSHITDQLSLTGQRLKTLQQLINQTIELDNFYHDKIWSSKKASSTPSTLKNEDASRYKKNFPSKPLTLSASTLAPSLKKSTKISLVLNKEGPHNLEKDTRREKEGLCLLMKLPNWQKK
ncbi:hypothetical protein VP01_733g4 [Puccinia sorghi]|uniref:Uncharacterized protein n=1 Tax=Puccinia sorghi TaxID=27349 RepID=A0A0L6UCS3_9BASI|nr:hypothetical protein VP01_733g4 [Puccinia sorghi]